MSGNPSKVGGGEYQNLEDDTTFDSEPNEKGTKGTKLQFYPVENFMSRDDESERDATVMVGNQLKGEEIEMVEVKPQQDDFFEIKRSKKQKHQKEEEKGFDELFDTETIPSSPKELEDSL